MKLVTGGAGFIGSHVVDTLAAREHVRVLDNLSSGRRSNVADHERSRRVEFVEGDLHDPKALARSLEGVDEVWHLAADPDVRAGASDPGRNFREGAVGTFELLEAMRSASARRIVFASTSTVYGEAPRPTPEEHGPCLPISVYGAAKLGAEGLLSAYAGTFGFQAWIYRFGNVVGPRLSHGVIHDFHRALSTDPTRLRILGDGTQEKSYLSTEDTVAGMLHGRAHATEAVNVLNLASEGSTSVARIAEIVVEEHGLRGVRFEYTGGDRGWPGDVRKMGLSIERVKRLGWRPRHSSEDAVRLAARWIARANVK